MTDTVTPDPDELLAQSWPDVGALRYTARRGGEEGRKARKVLAARAEAGLPNVRPAEAVDIRDPKRRGSIHDGRIRFAERYPAPPDDAA